MVAGRQWQKILESVASDTIHHLNGRIMGLRGVLHIAQSRANPDSEVVALLEDEVQRVEQLVARLLSLPRGQRPVSEILSVVDAVQQAAAADRLSRLTNLVVKAPSDVPLVVRASMNDLVKVLLLILAAVDQNRSGYDAGLTVAVSAAGDRATIAVSTQALTDPDGSAGEALAEARDLAHGFAGEISDAREAGVFTLTLAVPLYAVVSGT